MRPFALITTVLCAAPGCGLLVPHTSGLGVGAVVVPTSMGVRPDPAVAPSVLFDSRLVPRDDAPIGLVYRQTVMFHDWNATASVWRWYADPPDAVREAGNEALWYTFLFPTLFFAPFAGADLAGQPGVLIRPGAAYDRALPYVEVGPSFSLWLRPSYPQLAADLTLGGWVGVGFEPAERWDLAVRTTAAAPVVHALTGAIHTPIVSSALVLSHRPLTLAERRAKKYGPPALPDEPCEVCGAAGE